MPKPTLYWNFKNFDIYNFHYFYPITSKTLIKTSFDNFLKSYNETFFRFSDINVQHSYSKCIALSYSAISAIS